MTASTLNTNAQAVIAAVLAGGATLDSMTLIDRVVEHGSYQYRPYVQNLISRAYIAGMIERAGGSERRRIYRLNPDWELPQVEIGEHPVRRRQAPRAQAVAGPTLAYEGPAMGDGPLTPSLGTLCGQTLEEQEGELPPWLGGRIVDHLQRSFDEIFKGVE